MHLTSQKIVELFQNYGMAFVFVSVLCDKIGLPLPSYPTLLLAGAVSVSTDASIVAITLAATSGAIVADTVWYAIGRGLDRRALALVCRVTVSPDSCVRQTETLFSRIGPYGLLFSKFIPGFSFLSNALCGITRTHLVLFLVLDGIGAAIYLVIPILIGRVFYLTINDLLARIVQLGEYGAALVVGAFAAYFGSRFLRRQLFIRRLRMDRISVEELAHLIESGEPPLIFDVRPAETRASGVIPGAIGAHKSDGLAIEQDYPIDAEIIVYCSCPNEASAAVAALHLKRAGFRKIRPLAGGIDAWMNAGFPVSAAISISS